MANKEKIETLYSDYTASYLENWFSKTDRLTTWVVSAMPLVGDSLEKFFDGMKLSTKERTEWTSNYKSLTALTIILLGENMYSSPFELLFRSDVGENKKDIVYQALATLMGVSVEKVHAQDGRTYLEFSDIDKDIDSYKSIKDAIVNLDFDLFVQNVYIFNKIDQDLSFISTIQKFMGTWVLVKTLTSNPDLIPLKDGVPLMEVADLYILERDISKIMDSLVQFEPARYDLMQVDNDFNHFRDILSSLESEISNFSINFSAEEEERNEIKNRFIS